MKRMRRRCRPVLEPIEERRLPSSGAIAKTVVSTPDSILPVITTLLGAEFGALESFSHTLKQGHGSNAHGARYSLGPDSGTLNPPFVQFRADRTPPTPGAVYNVAFLTVRNGTTQTFRAGSGFSAALVGGSGSQPFPTGTTTWSPQQVFVFYSLTRRTGFPSFTFDLNGTRTTVPGNIAFNIQYLPQTFPGVLNNLAAQSAGGRYQLTTS
jgi:hypothetical protein